jgi:hypothetical protein
MFASSFIIERDLLEQELKMWKLLDHQVEGEELDFICQRRGFSAEGKGILINSLKIMGLGDKLNV